MDINEKIINHWILEPPNLRIKPINTRGAPPKCHVSIRCLVIGGQRAAHEPRNIYSLKIENYTKLKMGPNPAQHKPF